MNTASLVAVGVVAALSLVFFGARNVFLDEAAGAANVWAHPGICGGVEGTRGESGALQRVSRGGVGMGNLCGSGGRISGESVSFGCVEIMAIFGAVTANRKILWVQAVPGAVALALVCAARP